MGAKAPAATWSGRELESGSQTTIEHVLLAAMCLPHPFSTCDGGRGPVVHPRGTHCFMSAVHVLPLGRSPQAAN